MKRAAFTLLELLLVLALISMISGIGVMGYQRQHARSEFKAGLVELQVDLNRTRLLAMRSGQAYFFRFIPGTGIYEIAPLNTLQEAIYRMNGDVVDDLNNPLGGSLSSAGGFSAASGLAGTAGYSTGVPSYETNLYGTTQEPASDNLFSEENIAADLEKSGRSQPNAYINSAAPTLGGSLAGVSAASGSEVVNPFAAISGDGLGTGGEFALGTDLALANTMNLGITIREMNSDERPLGDAPNTIAWRVNNDGLVVRKEAKGGVIFTFSRLSDSTPTNLRDRRPGGVSDAQNAQGSTSDTVGEDLGSRLGGSLLAPPEATGSDALGGGLTASTSGIYTEENALTNYTTSCGPISFWSEPILFYPNGRASTVAIGLASVGKYSYYSEIGVRGMTGYARIADITTIPTEMTLGASMLTQEQLFRMTNPGVAYTGTDGTTGLAGGAPGGAAAAAASSGGALGGPVADAASGGGLAGAGDMTGGFGADAFGGLGMSGTSDTSSTGFTPGYGSTTRRSGYQFNGGQASGGAANAGGGMASGAGTGASFESTTSGLAGSGTGPGFETTGAQQAGDASAFAGVDASLGGGTGASATGDVLGGTTSDNQTNEKDEGTTGGALR